jgi:predicted alpha/beta hydrolase family esterase
MTTKILTIPGYGGSGQKHWQSYWEKEYDNIQRVEQDDWDNPQLAPWVERLNSYINNDEKVLLVGHSLACSLISHWALKHDTDSIIGALLVSPADVDSPKHTPEEVRDFMPMPLEKLHFKSIVVASDNDPYVSFERAKLFADAWGSDFINCGSHGHINAESGLSSWEFGKDLMNSLVQGLNKNI